MNRSELIALAASVAASQGIDPPLLQSLCHHESGNWDVWSVRYEPAFYDRYVAKITASATEKTMRATSFGLCQIMGQVARELGYSGPYLTELLDPELNMTLGCKKLRKCLDAVNGDVRAALLRYNGGGIPNYPDLVLAHMAEYGG